MSEYEKVINKVHSILQSLNIPSTRYESKLDDLNYTFSSFSDSLKRTHLNNSNLTNQITRITSKSEEIRIWIEKLELELNMSRDDAIYLKRDNLALLKQRNIFCLIVKCLYFNITQLHTDCGIG